MSSERCVCCAKSNQPIFKQTNNQFKDWVIYFGHNLGGTRNSPN